MKHPRTIFFSDVAVCRLLHFADCISYADVSLHEIRLYICKFHFFQNVDELIMRKIVVFPIQNHTVWYLKFEFFLSITTKRSHHKNDCSYQRRKWFLSFQKKLTVCFKKKNFSNKYMLLLYFAIDIFRIKLPSMDVLKLNHIIDLILTSSQGKDCLTRITVNIEQG